MNMNTDDWDANDWDNYWDLAQARPQPMTAYRVNIRFFDGYLGEEGMDVLFAEGLGDREVEESQYFWFLDGVSIEDALELYSEENSEEDWYIVGGIIEDVYND